MKRSAIAIALMAVFLGFATAQVATDTDQISWTKETSVPFTSGIFTFATPTAGQLPMICGPGASGIEVHRRESGTWNSYDVDPADTTASICSIEAVGLNGPFVLTTRESTNTLITIYTSTDGQNWVQTGATTTKGNLNREEAGRPFILGLNTWALIYTATNVVGNWMQLTEDGGDSWTLTSCSTISQTPAGRHFIFPTSPSNLFITSNQDGASYVRPSTTSACTSSGSGTKIYDVGGMRDESPDSYFGPSGMVFLSTVDPANTHRDFLFHPLDAPISAGQTIHITDDVLPPTAKRNAAAFKGTAIAAAYFTTNSELAFLLSTDGGQTWVRSVIDQSPAVGTLTLGFVGDTVSVFLAGAHYSSSDLGLSQDLAVPSEFDSGFVAFFESLGFRTAESKMFLALALVGLIAVAMGRAARTMAPGRTKNITVAGPGIIMGVFCAMVLNLELWMFIIAVVLGVFSLKGFGALRNTLQEIKASIRSEKQQAATTEASSFQDESGPAIEAPGEPVAEQADEGPPDEAPAAPEGDDA